VNPRRRALADSLYAASREHDDAEADRLARWRNVEPETAQLLAVLMRAMGARRILEIGTSNGYSTLWLGDAAEAVGGHVVSLEILPERTAAAAENVAAAALDGIVELRTEESAPACSSSRLQERGSTRIGVASIFGLALVLQRLECKHRDRT
jgi:predicted O-methyltransferase YrrM